MGWWGWCCDGRLLCEAVPEELGCCCILVQHSLGEVVALGSAVGLLAAVVKLCGGLSRCCLAGASPFGRGGGAAAGRLPCGTARPCAVKARVEAVGAGVSAGAGLWEWLRRCLAAPPPIVGGGGGVAAGWLPCCASEP